MSFEGKHHGVVQNYVANGHEENCYEEGFDSNSHLDPNLFAQILPKYIRPQPYFISAKPDTFVILKFSNVKLAK